MTTEELLARLVAVEARLAALEGRLSRLEEPHIVYKTPRTPDVPGTVSCDPMDAIIGTH